MNMNFFRILPVITALTLSFILPNTELSACTLWGAAGSSAAGGGTLLSKNRDWKPDHTQITKVVRPKKGNAYFGLYAEDNDEPGIKMGINDKGLCVITASAGSIPKKMRDDQPGKHGKIATILSRFSSVDELLEKKDEIFTTARASIYMVSDNRKIATFEVALKGTYSVKVETNGTITHTNHFLTKELEAYNYKIGKSSAIRFARVNTLVNESKKPMTVQRFTEISRDRNDGPDNSLWRVSKIESTLASWILETPQNGAPKLQLVIANPGKKEETKTIVFDDEFWKNAK